MLSAQDTATAVGGNSSDPPSQNRSPVPAVHPEEPAQDEGEDEDEESYDDDNGDDGSSSGGFRGIYDDSDVGEPGKEEDPSVPQPHTVPQPDTHLQLLAGPGDDDYDEPRNEPGSSSGAGGNYGLYPEHHPRGRGGGGNRSAMNLKHMVRKEEAARLERELELSKILVVVHFVDKDGDRKKFLNEIRPDYDVLKLRGRFIKATGVEAKDCGFHYGNQDEPVDLDTKIADLKSLQLYTKSCAPKDTLQEEEEKNDEPERVLGDFLQEEQNEEEEEEAAVAPAADGTFSIYVYRYGHNNVPNFPLQVLPTHTVKELKQLVEADLEKQSKGVPERYQLEILYKQRLWDNDAVLKDMGMGVKGNPRAPSTPATGRTPSACTSRPTPTSARRPSTCSSRRATR